MNWRAIGSATSGGLVWASPDGYLHQSPPAWRPVVDVDRGGSRLPASLGRAWLVLVAINQMSCALRFFFGVTPGRPEAFHRIISAKEPKKLPVVLPGEEIVRFLQAVPGPRNRAAQTTAYGAGLRCATWPPSRSATSTAARWVIRVEHGKSLPLCGNDRYVTVSPQLLRILRACGRLTKPAAWLFPGRQGDRPVGTATLQAACRVAAREADLGNAPALQPAF
jgi:integrase/recombinase XerD